MKFIPAVLLLISTPLWAAVTTNTNVLTVKAEVVSGSCNISASDVDLGDLEASAFASGGAWANLSATAVGNVATKSLKISARCDSGSVAKTLVLSFNPQKAQLTGNQIFPNEYTGPVGNVTASTAASNVGVVVFNGSTNVLNKDNTSAVNFSNYKGSTSTYSDYTFKARYQKVDSSKSVTPGGVLSQVQISVSYK
ncbi:fimbrial protein [Citrobacter sp. RHBSTW-00671]|uniref:fimbrial protein n=1 Tax=Citrobacter sp. RHBSTW-00671 TaxID=2742660 RepID=UPI0017BBB1DF|nr:fimbrial protein [Citrobacter sp. RHBSTW-00671]MBA7967398.1 fimbrial protein StaF [Citrobacter sp. RHBSTW-00671]HCJ6372773.1 fimbrial protein StaF [Citrobacter freundii]